MVALQIRDVPEDVRNVLAERARTQGQSLQALLLRVVTDEARRSANLLLLARFEGRDDGSRMSAADAVEARDDARGERDAQLARVVSGVSAPPGVPRS